MHLLLLTRGIQQQRDLWKKFMETHMWWWKRRPLLKDKDGKFIPDGIAEDGTPKYKRGEEVTTKVQGALRPLELCSYVFPEECLPEVLAMLNAHKNEPNRPEVKTWSWFLRKMMKLLPVPKMPKEIADKEKWEITDKYVPMEAMAVYPIGIKKDYKQDMIFPNGEGWYQEGL